MPGLLSFGVPSLDELFGGKTFSTGSARDGILIPGCDEKDGSSRSSVSICISGPDGTGKSILGMHMVSTYLADCQAWQQRISKSLGQWTLPQVKVLYVSTDLKYEMANKMWLNFGLDQPSQRVVPFTSALPQRKFAPKTAAFNIGLSPCSPLDKSPVTGGSQSLAERLAGEAQTSLNGEVLFVDLAAVTAGDDWGFVNRVLSVLEPLQPGQPCHLLVIDSVEGFETLGGGRDAFGGAQERRSRIAQVMRSAANKCHTLFIVEEPEEGKRLPEEFVTDVVIRLRSQMVKDYVRRTLEIEKARGHSHVRGQHAYMIRPGRGSTTGRQENHDEPAIPALAGPEDRAKTQSYLHVCHSLHYLNRDIMATAGKGKPANPPEHYAAFGIRYLDDMLEHGEAFSRPHRINGNDWRGLRGSTTTALIGNSDTQKSPLGVAFLARCFRAYAARLEDALAQAREQQGSKDERQRALFDDDLERAKRLAELWQKAVYEGDKKKRYPNNNLERQAEVLYRLGKIQRVSKGDKGDYFETIKDDKGPEPECLDTNGVEKLTEQERNLLCVAVLRLGPPKAASAENAITAKDEPEGGNQTKNGDGIPVLLTTQDVHAQELAYKFLPWLKRKVPGLKKPGGLATLRLLMEEYTICRRLEIHDLPSAVFFHIVKCAIGVAQMMLYPGRLNEDSLLNEEVKDFLSKNPQIKELYDGAVPLSGQTEERFQQSWAIRVVIEDFSILKNTYIEIRDEPLLLRFLIFYLGREGVTTLLIDTQSGQPDMALAGPLESELRSLVYSRLYTWRFNFYGEHRVAIAPIPPISRHRPAIVREVRLGTDLAPELDTTPLVVDPHFELYAGIEKGEPQPVPLQIRLFGENENFRAYIDEENAYYQEWFVPVSGGAQIILSTPPDEYDKLRDFCYLQRDTRLDYTLISQVDEFWYLRRKGLRRAGSFRPQWEYLNGVTAYTIGRDKEGKDKWVREWANDPFGLYQETEIRKKQRDPSKPYIVDYRRRRDEFRELSYAMELREKDEDAAQPTANKKKTNDKNEIDHVDRVPFMWDFGFLLCKVNQWKECGEVELPFWKKSYPNEPEPVKVRDVWKDLPKVWGEKKSKSTPRPSWRKFLEACYQVARASSYRLAKSVPAFDLHAIAAQTFSCLVLEIWVSEMYQRKKGKSAKEGFSNERCRREWDMDKLGEGLIEWLGDPKCQEDLFKTWLMLVEVLDLTELAQSVRGTNLRLKDANSQAVAVRHWYKTACHTTEHMSPDDPLVPVGLPGHFAIRGDWFLAVAGGSRSSRLADNALDLLTSRRANHTRLKRGLGLPVRYIEADGELRTGLSTFNKGAFLSGFSQEPIYRIRQVKYKDLLSLGSEKKDDEFYWLWRSSLRRYYRHVKLWQDWLNHMILWWERLRYLERDGWVNGFERYDWIEKNEARGLGFMEPGKAVCLTDDGTDNGKPLKLLGAWEYFQDSCSALQKELREATRVPERPID